MGISIASVRRLLATALLLVAGLAPFARAETADFYRGKTISNIVGFGPGGVYDLRPFSAKDHEAITANIPIMGLVKGGRVVPAHPEDLAGDNVARFKPKT